MSDYWQRERDGVLFTFTSMLAEVTGDGSKKRQAGEKPPWWKDGSHEGAIFSHLTKWKRGEKVDKDSGAHPLVHLAWRALAIAYQETYGLVDPVPATDGASYKEDVAHTCGIKDCVGGSVPVANFPKRSEGVAVVSNEASPVRMEVDYTSPRIRSLREHGLKG